MAEEIIEQGYRELADTILEHNPGVDLGRVRAAFELADRAFSENPMAPGLTNEQRQGIVKRHAAVRNRAAAFGKLVHMNEQAKVRIAEAASDIDAAWRQLIGNVGDEYALLVAGKEIPFELRARARRDQAIIDLERTVVRAPVDGVVAKRQVQLGQRVAAGTTLMTVVPLHQVWVEANFKETQLQHMQPGQRVEVILDAYPDQPVEGIIDSLAPATGAKFALLPPENATGNFTKIVQRVPVKIRIPDPGALAGKLLPGLSTEVIVDTRTPDPVVAAH